MTQDTTPPARSIDRGHWLTPEYAREVFAAIDGSAAKDTALPQSPEQQEQGA
ncbi:hypothetical protein K2X14_14140 [Acetobacter sp. TBRC 12305]|uniref:Uncharacterized protein n=1 Tax=Acetobacter garciniae TaxID=2817435 RepID=A0A939HQS0_9PROT|nr:hypothetical protein [Acetobacter garciniae]MBO1326287.1 hypothetical protein [Acetobacter garciniae]MBX0345974.1 hypothetical protein [Acetobacter garciniae]